MRLKYFVELIKMSNKTKENYLKSIGILIDVNSFETNGYKREVNQKKNSKNQRNAFKRQVYLFTLYVFCLNNGLIPSAFAYK